MMLNVISDCLTIYPPPNELFMPKFRMVLNTLKLKDFWYAIVQVDVMAWKVQYNRIAGEYVVIATDLPNVNSSWTIEFVKPKPMPEVVRYYVGGFPSKYRLK